MAHRVPDSVWNKEQQGKGVHLFFFCRFVPLFQHSTIRSANKLVLWDLLENAHHEIPLPGEQLEVEK
jgi:hypothetical protein